MKELLTIISATIELFVSLISPQTEPVYYPSDIEAAEPAQQSVVEVYEEPESFAEDIKVISPLPEQKSEHTVPVYSWEPEISPAPRDENGNITGPGTATTYVYYIVE